jgi:hypothetical protein
MQGERKFVAALSPWRVPPRTEPEFLPRVVHRVGGLLLSTSTSSQSREMPRSCGPLCPYVLLQPSRLLRRMPRFAFVLEVLAVLRV